MHLIEDHAKEAGIPVRFAASKLAENDELVLEKLKLSQNEKELLEHINLQIGRRMQGRPFIGSSGNAF